MIKGVTFSDPIATAKAQVAALEAEKCDLIVCLGIWALTTSTGNRSTDLLAAVTGIDLFIDGHSHTVIDGMNDYATGGTMLVSTGTAFANIGVVTYADGKLPPPPVPVTADMAAAADVKAAADEITAPRSKPSSAPCSPRPRWSLTATAPPATATWRPTWAILSPTLWYGKGKSGIAVGAASPTAAASAPPSRPATSQRTTSTPCSPSATLWP